MSEIEKAFEAGFRAYREAFDHYDDSDETVEHSLKWRMAQYIVVRQSAHQAALPHTETAAYCPHCQGQTVIGLPAHAQNVESC